MHHGPVMLAWAAVRFITMESNVDTPQVGHRKFIYALKSSISSTLISLKFGKDLIIRYIGRMCEVRGVCFDNIDDVVLYIGCSKDGEESTTVWRVSVSVEFDEISAVCGRHSKSF